MRRFPVRAWGGAMAARNDLRLNAKDLIAVAGDLGAQGAYSLTMKFVSCFGPRLSSPELKLLSPSAMASTRTHLNQVLKGKSRVSGSLLKCLGLRKAYTLEQAAHPGRTGKAHSLAPALQHVEA